MIYVFELYFDRFGSVVVFCGYVVLVIDELDVVVLNVGVGGYDFRVLELGYENIMQVNVYLNIFLVVEFLLLFECMVKVKFRFFCLIWVGSFVQMGYGFIKKFFLFGDLIIFQLDDVSRFDKSRYQDLKLLIIFVVECFVEYIDKNLVFFNEVFLGLVLINFGFIYFVYFCIVFFIVGYFINKEK